jgi:outer membrane autotransporter protein
VIAGPGSLRVSEGDFVNKGTIAPGGEGTAGTLTVVGNLDLSSSSSNVIIDVADNTSGNYDVLSITGNVTMGGTLTVKIVGSPTFLGADLHVITTGSTPTGSFTPDLPVPWNYSIQGNDVRIVKILGLSP